jgi:hypothetical protein
MKRIVLLGMCICNMVYADAQLWQRPLAAGIGAAAYSTWQVDALSMISNPAALAGLNKMSAAIYMERRFLVSELSAYSFAAALPASKGNLGLSGYHHGYDYNETKIGLAYARRLGSAVKLAAQFNYYESRVAGYGNTKTIGGELGIIWHLSKQLNVGIHIDQPAIITTDEERLKSLYAFGCGYETSDKFLTAIEFIKEEDQPPAVNVSLQYRFIETCMANAGISSLTSSAWMGVRFYWKTFQVGVMAVYHNRLGATPGVLFGFNKRS